MIPRAFIDELLARSDIVEVIDGYVPLRKAGKDFSARCPFHEEKSPSFSVSREKQFYYCFGCGAGGNVLNFLIEYNRLEFVEAVEELAARYGLDVPQEGRTEGDSGGTARRETLYKILEQAATFYRTQLVQHAEAGQARDYLQKRGLNAEIVAEFGLGYAPPGWRNLLDAFGTNAAQRDLLNAAGLLVEKDRVYDRFRERLIFPIHDQRGRVIAFGGRVLDDSTPKYLNSPETQVFQKSRELYGLHAVHRQRPAVAEIVVVEGYMDVVALAQYGVRNAVATLGTALTNEHLKRLFRSVDRVVFSFDGDAAGRKAAWRALETALPVLHEGRATGFVFLPAGEDPDSLVRKIGAEGFQAQISNATSLADFMFEELGAGNDLNKLEGRARLMERVIPLLERMPAGPMRSLVQERLRDVDARNLTAAAGGEHERRVSTLSNLNRSRRARPHQQPTATKNSLMRTVVGLLVQQPHLVTYISPHIRDLLPGVEARGMDLLLALLDFMDAHGEEAHAGMILENWRDTEHEVPLRKLAAWDHGLSEQGMVKEFQDAVRRLAQLYAEQRVEALLAKSRLGRLDAAEKQELQGLIAERP